MTRSSTPRPAMMTALVVLTLIAVLALRPAAAGAEPAVSAPDAHDRIEAGEMVLLDIRTPSEWNETGVAQGAWPVTMHSREFGRQLGRILQETPGKTIGLICATGGRTAYVWRVLRENGLTNVVDISEGMMGSDAGPGWLKRGLPTVSARDAVAALPAYLSE